MIAPPGNRLRRWQSPDHLVEAGEASLNGFTYAYASLGPRPIGVSDVKLLIHVLKSLPERLPLVLLSCCPGFTLSSTEETQGLVFYAGAYRALQQQRKANGGLILSYAAQVAVGGIYLMHGLAAQRRAAAEGTVFYDTVPSRPAVALAQAQARGLLDAIIPPSALESWITAELAESGPQSQP
jgi:hypothetical protein